MWRVVCPFVHAPTREKIRFIGGSRGRQDLLTRIPAQVGGRRRSVVCGRLWAGGGRAGTCWHASQHRWVLGSTVCVRLGVDGGWAVLLACIPAKGAAGLLGCLLGCCGCCLLWVPSDAIAGSGNSPLRLACCLRGVAHAAHTSGFFTGVTFPPLCAAGAAYRLWRLSGPSASGSCCSCLAAPAGCGSWCCRSGSSR